MINALAARWKQGHRTIGFPDAPPTLPARFRGRPERDAAKCAPGCRACAEVCPVQALAETPAGGLDLDLGRCLFCGECAVACPAEAITFSRDYRLAARNRDDLFLNKWKSAEETADALHAAALRLFGRSLKLRQVSAGGCNACEADVNVLNTIVFDLSRFGIQFVASPRHADGLLITGPVPENMRLAVQKTYEAVPEPKLVIAVGACAISGGIYRDHPQTHNGVENLLPVDLYIPGCPPHPITILDGLLGLLGKRSLRK